VGAALRLAGPERWRPPSGPVGADLIRALPRADRQALRATLQSAGHMPQDRETEALDTALRATPFDKAALAALMAREAQTRAQWLSGVQAAWLDQVAGMSDAERAAYADRLAEMVSRRHHHWRKRDDDHETREDRD